MVFYGDHIWEPQFGEWFSRFKEWPSSNVNDLDTLDGHVIDSVYEELNNNGGDFDIMLLHLIGVDCAGHTFGSKHSEITRKLMDTEQFIANMIDKMDDDTTLVIFGDHGMTEDGSHGGSTNLEMHTVLFSYQKKPFPMGKKYRAMHEQFAKMDRSMKQVDVAAIGSMILNVPYPFSNLGIGHPAFGKSDDLKEVAADLRDNIEQVHLYIEAYCAETSADWCDFELDSFKTDLKEIDDDTGRSDLQIIAKI